MSGNWTTYVALVGGAALLILMIRSTYRQVRLLRMRPAERIALYYDGMCELGADLGVARQPHDTPAEYLRDADIFLSTSHEEGLNMSIVEAMAAGVPVVATDIPPHRESIVHLETGLLFPPGDTKEMVEALTLLLDEPERADRIRQKAAKAAERFDCVAITERIYRVYAEVVARAE